jgi:hypothetical protein
MPLRKETPAASPTVGRVGSMLLSSSISSGQCPDDYAAMYAFWFIILKDDNFW